MTKQLITPQEARRVSDGGKAEIVARIDAAIRRAATDNRWPCTIDVANMNRRALADAILAFTAMGWRIGLVADERDGDFVQVEAP